ncbi:hypothetical protein FN846DRAFT_901626 [Sphaerosporella brunnea]|uniref:Uncharacterized protein n=1 Tax=Sphaerosporella brunnea TaxID=1250544 RepID=A0A5J5FBM4_9PEZI|nr:hypothetical protein FN846DRAFT_901626 [Sphaerosporella brunnea]
MSTPVSPILSSEINRLYASGTPQSLTVLRSMSALVSRGQVAADTATKDLLSSCILSLTQSHNLGLQIQGLVADGSAGALAELRQIQGFVANLPEGRVVATTKAFLKSAVEQVERRDNAQRRMEMKRGMKKAAEGIKEEKRKREEERLKRFEIQQEALRKEEKKQKMEAAKMKPVNKTATRQKMAAEAAKIQAGADKRAEDKRKREEAELKVRMEVVRAAQARKLEQQAKLRKAEEQKKAKKKPVDQEARKEMAAKAARIRGLADERAAQRIRLAAAHAQAEERRKAAELKKPAVGPIEARKRRAAARAALAEEARKIEQRQPAPVPPPQPEGEQGQQPTDPKQLPRNLQAYLHRQQEGAQKLVQLCPPASVPAVAQENTRKRSLPSAPARQPQAKKPRPPPLAPPRKLRVAGATPAHLVVPRRAASPPAVPRPAARPTFPPAVVPPAARPIAPQRPSRPISITQTAAPHYASSSPRLLTRSPPPIHRAEQFHRPWGNKIVLTLAM